MCIKRTALYKEWCCKEELRDVRNFEFEPVIRKLWQLFLRVNWKGMDIDFNIIIWLGNILQIWEVARENTNERLVMYTHKLPVLGVSIHIHVNIHNLHIYTYMYTYIQIHMHIHVVHIIIYILHSLHYRANTAGPRHLKAPSNRVFCNRVQSVTG